MKYKILFGYMILFSFMSQMAAMGAPTLFQGVVDNPSALACEPEGMLGILTCFLSNMGIFFRLMTVSSGYAIISAVLVVPFVVMMIYIVAELIARAIP